MLYTFNNETLDFYNMNKTKIGIEMSGGINSSLLLYLLCKEFPNAIIVPIVYSTTAKQNNGIVNVVKDIILRVKKDFPCANITEPYVKEYEFYCELVHTYGPDQKNEIDPFTGAAITNHLYERRKFIESLVDQNIIESFVRGIIANPSKEIMDELDIYDQRIAFKDTKSISITNYKLASGNEVIQYNPFTSIGKEFIVHLYKEFNLMNTLLPLTKSCVSVHDDTPCGKCWWCKIRKYYFGDHDET